MRLQHGWVPGPGVRPECQGEPWTKLVWSHRNLAQARALGIPSVDSIGAPFLYLPEVADAAPSRGARSLLAVPFHSWEQEQVVGDFEAYADALATLERDGFSPITVCLYHVDHRDASLRERFTRRGFEVVTMGPRDGNPSFLVRQRELIRAHRYVTSNRVATVAFYTLVSGRPFFFHGPVFGVSGTDDPRGERFAEWQMRELGALAYDVFRDTVERAIGERELGLEYKRPPEEIGRLLGFGAMGPALRLGLRARIAAWDARAVVARALGRAAAE